MNHKCRSGTWAICKAVIISVHLLDLLIDVEIPSAEAQPFGFCWPRGPSDMATSGQTGVSKNTGTPKWMVKIMENPMNKWMIWGVLHPYFWVDT